MNATFDWGLIWDYRSDFAHAVVVALQVSTVGLILSLVAGLALALARMSHSALLVGASSAYINVFRGIPALVSVIWVYFGVSLAVGVNFSVFQAGVIALTLLYGAFFAETFRAALSSIPPGQREAGLALGLSRGRVFLSVTLPQAVKVAMPNIGSNYIGMVKDTSVFTVIGLQEIVRVTQTINSATFQPFVLYTAAAGIYVLVAFALDFVFRTGEKALSFPPSGPVGTIVVRRRRRRVQQITERLTRTPGPQAVHG